MKNCRKKKTVKKQETDGRDIIEVSPENNLNTDKEASSFSEFQRRPQSKSVRYAKSIKKPYRAPRMGTKSVRKKKI
jgi:hypothetical protein